MWYGLERYRSEQIKSWDKLVHYLFILKLCLRLVKHFLFQPVKDNLYAIYFFSNYIYLSIKILLLFPCISFVGNFLFTNKHSNSFLLHAANVVIVKTVEVLKLLEVKI